MAKGKYHDWLTPEGLLQISSWARDGLTDEEIAKKIGIRRETLYVWMKTYPNISNALKNNKELADQHVEQALFRKATGYKTKEIIRERQWNKATGQYELVTVKEVEKDVAPDTTAQIFWLKNRKPDTWRDKREVDTGIPAGTFDAVSEVTAQILQATDDRQLDSFLTEDGEKDE